MKINKKIFIPWLGSVMVLIFAVSMLNTPVVITELNRVEQDVPEDFENKYEITPQQVGKSLIEDKDYIALKENGFILHDNRPVVLGDSTANMEALGNKERTPRFTLSFLNMLLKPGIVRYEDVEPGDTISDVGVVTMLDDIPALLMINFKNSVPAEKVVKGIEGIDVLALKDWINFPNGNKITFFGSGQIQFPFEINVPEGVAPGDYIGFFFATLEGFGDDFVAELEAADGDVEALLEAKNAAGVGARISLAVGLEFILRIVGDVYASMNFNTLDYTLDEDRGLILKFGYDNRGNISLVPMTNVVVSDTLGRRVLNEEYNFALVNPGVIGESSVALDMERFNPFAYGIHKIKAELYYTYYSYASDDKVKGGKYLAGAATLRLYVIPWTLVIVLMGILVLFLSFMLFRNYSLFRLAKMSKVYIVKNGDTLEIVSKKFKVDPKKIIRLNSLKTPYFLEEKSKLLIPKDKK